MKLFYTILLGLFGIASHAAPPVVEIRRDMVIKSSVQIKKAIYLLNAYDSLNKPLITITGNNITVDFNKAFLQGSTDRQLPNQFYGLAILIKGNNITIKNARISGFKIALMANNCNNLKIENSDFSYNYRQHLQSTWLHEDVSDWMSYHHNENDEWMRYGAGIYLKNCTKATIKNNSITGGQCALLMTNCNDGLIADNDFSFNSAIGIGMYRSSRNNIMHNKLDFNVRGYSHGFYNRGQDSAGILVFEQCNENVFAYNSVTHGGDGFFLWAGQTTMDSGEGGCNENYIYANDFSYAPTNGIEVTFSKNHIRYNTIKECDHGVWGGYSWETSIGQNKFEKNRIGVAIEHGQNNAIISNQFNNDKEAIKLWARKQQPSDWGYANKRDIRSMHYRIWENDFTGNKTALNITMTDETEFINNKFSNVTTAIKKDSSVTNFKETIPVLYDSIGYTPPIINNWKNKKTPFLKIPAGKKQIRITEWGPYDYRYPIIFLNKIDSNNVYYFDVLGPKGKWKIKKLSGAENVSIKQGVFPAAMQVKKNGDDLQLELEYTGEAFTNQFGKKQEANMPYTFSFRDYTPTMAWNVKWWRWYVDTNPIKAYSWIDYLKERVQPNDSAVTNKLDYTWWGKPTPNVPADTFITIATSTINVQKGMYRLGITADDLVKVYVDEKLVIDFWDVARYINDEDAHHEATVELNGRHNIRVEHTENTGYATLIFTLKPL